MLLKYCFYLHHKHNIETCLQYKTLFWDYRKMGQQHYIRFKKIFKSLNIVQYCAMVIGLSVVVMYSLRPFFNEKNKFVFESWTPIDSIVLETFVLCCQYYFLVFLVPVTLGYDSMYLSLSVHMVLQIRMLKYKIGTMSATTNTAEIYKCVLHHQLLLS